jgi:hypothetical protein
VLFSTDVDLDALTIYRYYLKDARNPRLISDSVKKQSVASVT